MKPRFPNRRNHALTLVEVLVVIVVLVILLLLGFPEGFFGHRLRKSQQISCSNNLKQIGLAYRIWSGDNNDKYPTGISVTLGGSMEMVATGNVTQTFLVMSNELSTPLLLNCSWDMAHIQTRSFAGLASSNISYFVGVDATNDMNPQMIISGDDNFEISGAPVKSGLVQFTTNSNVAWTSGRHVPYKEHFWTSTRGIFLGNIGLADGSVQQVTTHGLQVMLQKTGLTTNRLAIP